MTERPRRRAALLAVASIGVAAGTFWMLPSTAFQARVTVVISDPSSPLASTLARLAAEAAISDHVVGRAAASLSGTTGTTVSPPDLLERIGVTLGLNAAPSRAAQRAADLASRVSARSGDVPGTIDISASSATPEIAASTAMALAEALVADQDDAMERARRRRDAEVQARIDQLKAQALKARSRLAALGGTDADPAEQRAAAVGQTAAAQARVDAIRSIIASGTPPLSDRRDVPSGIETLQAAFLDLRRQLAKAQETLGDRHTTIISLKAEVAHAAASLTAEWRRLLRLAEADLASKRQRETSLRQETPADARRHEMFEATRRAVQMSDDNLIRAQAGQGAALDTVQAYRLMASAAIPTGSTGWPFAIRLVLAALAGAMAALGLRFAPARFAALEAAARPATPAVPTEVENVDVLDADLDRPWDSERRIAEPTPRPRAVAPERRPRASLTLAMDDLVPRLVAIEPAYGDIPTIMIASTEAGAETTPVATALGATLAALDYRVLVVEAGAASTALAERVDANATPLLVDLFGTLRVAFPAEDVADCLVLAPSLPRGARIASDLARDSRTPIVDDVAGEFDMLIIDGGRAVESAEAGWSADAYVRVGRFASRRHDDMFGASFGVPASAVVGTIVGSDFTPHEAPSAPRLSDPPPRKVPASRGGRATQTARPASVPLKTPRRRAMGR